MNHLVGVEQIINTIQGLKVKINNRPSSPICKQVQQVSLYLPKGSPQRLSWHDLLLLMWCPQWGSHALQSLAVQAHSPECCSYLHSVWDMSLSMYNVRCVVAVSLSSPTCPARQTVRLHRCTEVLLSALLARKVASREDLRKAWKDEPKCE